MISLLPTMHLGTLFEDENVAFSSYICQQKIFLAPLLKIPPSWANCFHFCRCWLNLSSLYCLVSLVPVSLLFLGSQATLLATLQTKASHSSGLSTICSRAQWVLYSTCTSGSGCRGRRTVPCVYFRMATFSPDGANLVGIKAAGELWNSDT